MSTQYRRNCNYGTCGTIYINKIFNDCSVTIFVEYTRPEQKQTTKCEKINIKGNFIANQILIEILFI